MTLNFFAFLTAISLFISALLSLFFFVTRRGNVMENRILAALMVIFTLQIFYSYMTSFYAPESSLNWHKLLFLIRQTSFLIGPLIYFYTGAFLKKKIAFRYDLTVHFIPFAGAMFFLPLYYRGVDRFIIWESPIDLYTTILILIHTLIYLVLSWRFAWVGPTEFKETLKGLRPDSQSRWIQILLVGFILVWMVNLNSFALYMILKRPGWCAYTASIYALVVFLFISSIMFLLLMKPEIFYFTAKYKNTRFGPGEKEEYLQRLELHMEQQKPYLNPDITLEILADEISINPRILSQLINETYQKNFKSYILEYRIKESMKLLSDTRHHKLTVLEVLYQVGFNSKSTFNNQFKLYTNQTPLEFKAQYLRN